MLLHMHTYAIEAFGLDLVKIGRAHDVIARLYSLSTASPTGLLLRFFAPFDVERALKKYLADHHSHGEWFALDDESHHIISNALAPITEEEYMARFPSSMQKLPHQGRPLHYRTSKRGAARKPTACGTCGHIGHNRATCRISISDE